MDKLYTLCTHLKIQPVSLGLKGEKCSEIEKGNLLTRNITEGD